MTLITFSKSSVQRTRSQTYSENALFWQRHTDRQFAFEDRLLYVFDSNDECCHSYNSEWNSSSYGRFFPFGSVSMSNTD